MAPQERELDPDVLTATADTGQAPDLGDTVSLTLDPGLIAAAQRSPPVDDPAGLAQDDGWAST